MCFYILIKMQGFNRKKLENTSNFFRTFNLRHGSANLPKLIGFRVPRRSPAFYENEAERSNGLFSPRDLPEAFVGTVAYQAIQHSIGPAAYSRFLLLRFNKRDGANSIRFHLPRLAPRCIVQLQLQDQTRKIRYSFSSESH